MRIAYCTNVRLPTERAHGHQVARVCDALTQIGHVVTVFAPFRVNTVTQDFHAFHGADARVQMRHLGRFDPIDKAWLPRAVQLPVLNIQLRRALAKALAAGNFDVLYTRTPALLATLLNTGIRTVLELHAIPRRHQRMFVRQCNRCALVVCLTSPMRDALVALGVEAARVVVEPDAVEAQRFVGAAARLFDGQGPFIGYAGQIESMGLSKGIPELLDAISLLRKGGHMVRGVIAGPPPKNDLLLHRLVSHAAVDYVGFLPSAEIPGFLAGCDVLVYPAPLSGHPFYMRDTSPLKLFEYMAAGKPIVTADLPPIRDVLDDSTAAFCKPGDPADLARAIAETLDRPDQARARAVRAQARVLSRYTWKERMSRILAAVPFASV
jgi:glycosyltransferase involved in cell wall biosynthesis